MVKNLILPKIRLRAISFIFPFLLIGTGCMSTTETTNPPEITETPIPNTPTVIESPMPVVTTATECVPTEIKVVDSSEQKDIIDFHWSDNGEFLFYQVGVEWWQFDTVSYETSQVTDLDLILPPQLPAYVTDHFPDPEDDELWYRSSLSPSSEKWLYWIPSDQSSFPVPVFELNSSNTEFEFPYDLFLFQEKSTLPLYIGRVDYPVKEAYWLPGEEEILLEMGGGGEMGLPQHWLWLIDVPTGLLSPVLADSEVRAPKFRVLDISPDGNWVMYQTATSNYVTMKNIHNGNTRPLYGLPSGIGAWWLPNGAKIVTVLNAGPGFYSVYIYNIQAEKITRIVSDIRDETLSNVRIGISANKTILAFGNSVYSGSDELFVIDLCLK